MSKRKTATGKQGENLFDYHHKSVTRLHIPPARREAWGEEERRDAVIFGPQYGPLTTRIVEEGIRIAARRGFDDVVFAAFSFDAQAQVTIQVVQDPAIKLHV